MAVHKFCEDKPFDAAQFKRVVEDTIEENKPKLKNISLISHIRAYQPAVKHVAVLSRTLKKGDGSNSLTEIARQISSGEDHPERPRSSVGTLAGLSVIHLQFLIVVGL